jgi:DnaK suppressor protein
MDNQGTAALRETLLAMRREIAGEVAALKREGFSLGNDGTQDIGDDAANTYARQVLLGQSEMERAILRQIDDALDRIEEGTFGECEECGDKIGPARLQALPYATLCVECKATQERENR